MNIADMNNLCLRFLILALLFCNVVNAQFSAELMQAESLIQKKEFEKALDLLNQVIEQKPRRFEMSNVCFQISKANLGLGNFEKATYYNKQSLSIRKKLHYEFIAENYMLFGLIELKKENNDRALGYFLKAAELPYESLEFSALLNAYIAQVYFKKGNIEKVLNYYKIAMGTWMTAYEEVDTGSHSHYYSRRGRLYYDNFFVGFL